MLCGEQPVEGMLGKSGRRRRLLSPQDNARLNGQSALTAYTNSLQRKSLQSCYANTVAKETHCDCLLFVHRIA